MKGRFFGTRYRGLPFSASFDFIFFYFVFFYFSLNGTVIDGVRL